MKTLPPAVILLDAPVAEGIQAGTEMGLAADDDPELALSPLDPALDVPRAERAFQFDVDPSTPPAAVGPEIRKVSSESRSTGEQRGFGGEILKIAIGGIAGLVIAQGLIWWMPWGWGRDPFKLAPQLPGPLAILAPAKFRDSALGNSFEARENDTIDTEFSRFDSDNGDLTAENEPASLSGNDDFQSLADEHHQEIGLGDRPVIRLADVRQAVEHLEAIDEPWSTSDLRRLARSFKSACELAWRLTFLSPEGESGDPALAADRQALSEQVDRLLAPLSKDPVALSRIGDIGAVWLDGKNRSVDGLLLAGTVESMEREGEYLITRIGLLGSQARTVPVVSLPLDDTYAVGDRVLILGAIVADPAADLLPLSGADPLVVLRGHVHNLPPAANTN